MKKIILSVAALSTALAQAQVGINQEKPKATLDISVKKDNIDNESQEGLLIPRVTKEKALKMANNSTTPPEESALIYVNDMALTSSADATVEDITEKGYYFWNGTKWVKSAGANGELWQKQENGNIKLVDADFPSNVEYKSYGGFTLSPKEKIEVTSWDFDDKDYKTVDASVPCEDCYISKSGYASKIASSNFPIGNFMSNSLLVNSTNYPAYRLAMDNIYISPENINDYTGLYSRTNNTNHSGKGTVDYILGTYNKTSLGSPDSKANNLIGGYNQVISYSSHHLPYMKGTYSYVTPRGTGTVNQIFGTESVISLNGNSSNVINSMVLSRNMASINNDFQGSVDKLIGFSTYFDIPYGNTSVKELYGLKITNVVVGTEKNYAIYTGLGDIRFGQFKDDNAVGNRLLTVDNDGKLAVGESTQSVAPLWSYVPDETKIKLDYLSDGVTPRPDDNSVYISDFGTVYMNEISVSGWQYYHHPSLESHFYSNGNKWSRLNFNKEWDGTKFIAKSNDGTPTFTGQILFHAEKGELNIGGSSTAVESEEQTDYNNVLKIDMKNQSVKVGKLNNNIPNNHTLIAVNEEGSAGIYKIATPQTGEELGKIDLGLRAGGLYESLASIKTISAGNTYVEPGTASNIGGHMTFATTPLSNGLSNDTAVPEERMRITSNGNVGIGTTTPTEKLEVAGSIKSTALAGVGNRVVLADQDGKLVVGANTSSMGLWANNTSAGLVELKATSNGTPRVNSGVRNDVTIDDSGKITARGFVGYNGATIFPDYVFEKYYTGESTIKADYNFHNLASVESFIKTNGHLPGYKSAKEIASKGLIDLGATQLTNVEKIEELYLHLIEKDKEVQELKSEMQSQKAELDELKKLVKQLTK